MKDPKANDRRFPLPRQTGHGDFPHPAFARAGSSRRHSQRDQPQMVQVSIPTDARTGTPAPLAATLQMSPQPGPHEVIELAEPLPRVSQPKIVGPAPPVTIHPPQQLRPRRMTLLRSDQTSQRLLFPVDRFARRLQVPVSLRPAKSASYTAVFPSFRCAGMARRASCADRPGRNP